MRRMTNLAFVMVAVLAAAPLHAAKPRTSDKVASQPTPKQPTAPAAKAKAARPSPYTLSSVSIGTAPAVVPSSASYAMNWHSVNSGGTMEATSVSYEMGATVGQPLAGEASSVSYEMGAGFWHGVGGGEGGCDCPFQSDFDEDGFLTALDLSSMIDILFAGQPDVKDPDCPSPRADFDCDGFSTALDLSGLIDHLFAGGTGPCDPCSP